MSEQGNKYFDPEKKNHGQLVDRVEKILQEEKKLNTTDLADKVEEAEKPKIKSATAKSLLYYAREHIEDKKDVETERVKDGTAGNATIYWKVAD